MEERGAPDPWASFQHDPRDPAVAPLRASDADRDVVHGVLTDAFADGRLDRDEYDERSGRGARGPDPGRAAAAGERPGAGPAAAARPGCRWPRPSSVRPPAAGRGALARRAPRARSSASSAPRSSAGRSGAAHRCFGGLPVAADRQRRSRCINVLRTLANKREIVAAEVRRLEKKRAKELEKKQAARPGRRPVTRAWPVAAGATRPASCSSGSCSSCSPTRSWTARPPGRAVLGVVQMVRGLHRGRGGAAHPGARAGWRCCSACRRWSSRSSRRSSPTRTGSC